MECTGRTLCFGQDFKLISRQCQELNLSSLIWGFPMECTGQTLCFVQDFRLIPRQSQELNLSSLVYGVPLERTARILCSAKDFWLIQAQCGSSNGMYWPNTLLCPRFQVDSMPKSRVKPFKLSVGVQMKYTGQHFALPRISG